MAATRDRGYCDVCGKTLSRSQTTTFSRRIALCLDCVLGRNGLAEEDRIEVSVDVLRRLRDGVI